MKETLNLFIIQKTSKHASTNKFYKIHSLEKEFKDKKKELLINLQSV